MTCSPCLPLYSLWQFSWGMKRRSSRIYLEQSGGVCMEYTIELAGVERGELRCREGGVRTAFSARCVPPGEGIYKVWLHGEGRMLLGTLAPEGGALILRRTLSNQALKNGGVWPPREASVLPAGETETEPGEWRKTDCRRILRDQALLRGAEAGNPRAWCRRERDGVTLAWNWEVGQPFPLPPAFCFGRMGQVNGKSCVMIHLGRNLFRDV